MLPTPQSNPRSLRVSGYSKSHAGRPALEDVTFSIHPGEVLGLIGPNGAGKTTLFECLAGSVVGAPERRSLLFYMPDAIAPWPAQPLGWALEFSLRFFGGRADLRDE